MKRNFILLLIMLTLNSSILLSQNQDFLFMVEQAIKAPSGHNTQPWLFKIKDTCIEIHANNSKKLAVVDSDDREMFISLGCATENICISALETGYNTNVEIVDSTVIIHLSKGETEKDALFGQIPVRQTNRSVYNGKIIPDSVIMQLFKQEGDKNKIKLYCWQNGSKEYDDITKCILKANIVQMQDKAFVSELKSWMRYNKKEQDDTNDGLSYAVFGAPNLPVFISKPVMGSMLNAKTQNKSDEKKIKSSSHFVLFASETNAIDVWINLGRELQRFLLKTTASGISSAYYNQPCEVKGLAEEMAKILDIEPGKPQILLRIGYGEKQAYSKRKPLNSVLID